jgi:hypothetical protein
VWFNFERQTKYTVVVPHRSSAPLSVTSTPVALSVFTYFPLQNEREAYEIAMLSVSLPLIASEPIGTFS